MQLTFIIIKPHILKHPFSWLQIQRIIENNFQVVIKKKIKFSKEMAETFYKEHEGRFYYNRLVTFMSSDPSEIYIVSAQNAIQKWRDLLGPTKVFQAIYSHPDSIRALYGLTDTRNGCHGSDSEESVKLEISKVLPEFDVDSWNSNNKI